MFLQRVPHVQNLAIHCDGYSPLTSFIAGSDRQGIPREEGPFEPEIIRVSLRVRLLVPDGTSEAVETNVDLQDDETLRGSRAYLEPTEFSQTGGFVGMSNATSKHRRAPSRMSSLA